MTPTIAGIFVGGRGERMGGVPKGLLVGPGGRTLLDHWREVLAEASVAVVLVGRHEAYGPLALEVLDDDPPGIGPLGGLVALLKRAGAGRALALACDMPFVSTSLIRRLVAAPPAVVVAPWRDDHWEPLCARYDAPRVLPVALGRVVARRHALQPLLAEAGVTALPIEPSDKDELHDWDAPADMNR